MLATLNRLLRMLQKFEFDPSENIYCLTPYRGRVDCGGGRFFSVTVKAIGLRVHYIRKVFMAMNLNR